MKHILRLSTAHHGLRVFVDIALVMLVIWLVSMGTSIHHGLTFMLFSLTVATIAALDLAFWRHLRRAYASPRRGVWRRV
jgi:hypothetical protein